MKKVLLCLSVIMFSLLLTGCSKNIEQTEERQLEQTNTRNQTEKMSLPQSGDNLTKDDTEQNEKNKAAQNKAKLDKIKNQVNDLDKTIDESDNTDGDVESSADIDEINNIEEEFQDEE